MADWFYRHQGKQFGPVPWDELRQLIRIEMLGAADLVSQDGTADWRPAGEVEGLFLPPPFPVKQQATANAYHAVPPLLTAGASAQAVQSLPERESASIRTVGPWQPQEPPATVISTPRHSLLGSPGFHVLKRQRTGLKAAVIIGGGFLLCCGLIAVILLPRTSEKPSRNGGSSVNHPSLPRQTSQITSSGGIEQDFANAQNALLRQELPSFIRNTDASRLAVWKAAAEKGTPEAQWLHGHVLLYGAHCEKAPEEALKWFRKAADQGNAAAQYALGGCYQFGQSQDYTEAMEWYRKAAEQGFVPAQTALAGFYYKGRGVPTDHAEALKWYRKAAEGGNAQAQFNLGIGYDKGDGVPQDYTEMAKWYRKAAEQGYAAAQHNLGCCYDEGVGVPKNHEEAMKWCRKAADQDYAPAQARLRAMGEFSASPIPLPPGFEQVSELQSPRLSQWGFISPFVVAIKPRPATFGTNASYDVLICGRMQPMQSCPNGAWDLITRCNVLLGAVAESQRLLPQQVMLTTGKRWEAIVYCNGRACRIGFAYADRILSASEPYTIELPEGSFVWSREDREGFRPPREIAILRFLMGGKTE